MGNIKILDCTLRDGGYINNFNFGKDNIKFILSKLQLANIDIIECGFLEDGNYDDDSSVYNKVDQIAKLLPQKRDSMFVAMACYGEYDISQLSPCSNNSITGIRVTFHYNEIDDALDYCKKIKDLGYTLFIQPVGTTSYSDSQLINLIQKVNEIKPYAFYLVDTLGLLIKEEVAKFFNLIDENLDKSINIGFHSHNNLQLSFSNCQYLASLDSQRTILLDSSVYGMGRGAGNLNTELIANYLNIYNHSYYLIEPLLEITDEVINKIKESFGWGYSAPYYLAAIKGCHPNYAAWLAAKGTLTIPAMSKILSLIDPENRSLFNKKLIERTYTEFMTSEINDFDSLVSLKRLIKDKKIILIGPGNSINTNKNEIADFCNQEDCVAISVGFIPEFFKLDMVFLSNLRRFKMFFNTEQKDLLILHTSNIGPIVASNELTFNYSSLLDEDELISDNSLLMFLRLMMKLGSNNRIILAGFDGYNENGTNFYNARLNLTNLVDNNTQVLNEKIGSRISLFNKERQISFLTPSVYQNYCLD